MIPLNERQQVPLAGNAPAVGNSGQIQVAEGIQRVADSMRQRMANRLEQVNGYADQANFVQGQAHLFKTGQELGKRVRAGEMTSEDAQEQYQSAFLEYSNREEVSERMLERFAPQFEAIKADAFLSFDGSQVAHRVEQTRITNDKGIENLIGIGLNATTNAEVMNTVAQIEANLESLSSGPDPIYSPMEAQAKISSAKTQLWKALADSRKTDPYYPLETVLQEYRDGVYDVVPEQRAAEIAGLESDIAARDSSKKYLDLLTRFDMAATVGDSVAPMREEVQEALQDEALSPSQRSNIQTSFAKILQAERAEAETYAMEDMRYFLSKGEEEKAQALLPRVTQRNLVEMKRLLSDYKVDQADIDHTMNVIRKHGDSTEDVIKALQENPMQNKASQRQLLTELFRQQYTEEQKMREQKAIEQYGPLVDSMTIDEIYALEIPSDAQNRLVESKISGTARGKIKNSLATLINEGHPPTPKQVDDHYTAAADVMGGEEYDPEFMVDYIQRFKVIPSQVKDFIQGAASNMDDPANFLQGLRVGRAIMDSDVGRRDEELGRTMATFLSVSKAMIPKATSFSRLSEEAGVVKRLMNISDQMFNPTTAEWKGANPRPTIGDGKIPESYEGTIEWYNRHVFDLANNWEPGGFLWGMGSDFFATVGEFGGLDTGMKEVNAARTALGTSRFGNYVEGQGTMQRELLREMKLADLETQGMFSNTPHRLAEIAIDRLQDRFGVTGFTTSGQPYITKNPIEKIITRVGEEKDSSVNMMAAQHIKTQLLTYAIEASSYDDLVIPGMRRRNPRGRPRSGVELPFRTRLPVKTNYHEGSNEYQFFVVDNGEEKILQDINGPITVKEDVIEAWARHAVKYYSMPNKRESQWQQITKRSDPYNEDGTPNESYDPRYTVVAEFMRGLQWTQE